MFNLIVAGPACSGKSNLLFTLLKNMEQPIHVALVSDFEEIPINNPGIYRYIPEPFIKNIPVKNKYAAIKEAVKRNPDLIVVDQVQESREAFLLYRLINQGKNIWFTVHGDCFNSGEENLWCWLAYFVNLLKKSGILPSEIEEKFFSKIDSIICLKTRRSGCGISGYLFSRGIISQLTIPGIVSMPITYAM